jgi:hypothetical protein
MSALGGSAFRNRECRTMSDSAARPMQLTAEEIEVRAQTLKQGEASRDGRQEFSTSKEDFQFHISLWQAALACEVRAGNGIDALYQILSAIKTQYADDESSLLSAIGELRNCADRHLTAHDGGTIDAIFRGVFTEKDDVLDKCSSTSMDASSEAFSGQRGTPQTTIEAIMWTVRTRGVAALNEPANIERLGRGPQYQFRFSMDWWGRCSSESRRRRFPAIY